MNFQSGIGLIRQTYSEWREDKVVRLGAALAYYSIFSIPPLIVIVLWATNLFYGGHSITAMQRQLSNLIGADTARSILQTQVHHGSARSLTKVMGIGILLFGATGVFASLQDALNTIWEVQQKSGQGFFALLRARFFSLAVVFGIMFLLMVSLVLTVVVSGITALVLGSFPGGETATHGVELGLSFVIVTVLFAVMFKMLPDVKLVWKDVWVGAAVTAALFTVGKFVMGLYLANASVGSAYGAAAPLVVLILWVYYSSQILLFGAEFTQVYANRYGSRVVPADNAEPVTEEKRAQEGLQPKTPERSGRDDGGKAA